jgi:hypothetical protein
VPETKTLEIMTSGGAFGLLAAWSLLFFIWGYPSIQAEKDKERKHDLDRDTLHLDRSDKQQAAFLGAIQVIQTVHAEMVERVQKWVKEDNEECRKERLTLVKGIGTMQTELTDRFQKAIVEIYNGKTTSGAPR